MLTIKPRETAMIGALLFLALGIVIAVASMFPPLTDADRAEMIIDATQGLPQDR